MIISHKLKCIFIKPKKVGGTSFEVALSKYCGDKDIITPISNDDETLRKELGYRGSQNYENPFFAVTTTCYSSSGNAKKRKCVSARTKPYNQTVTLA